MYQAPWIIALADVLTAAEIAALHRRILPLRRKLEQPGSEGAD